MDEDHKHINSIGLIALLFAISFFKDDVTPDYLNTHQAQFIGTATNRIETFLEQPQFWIIAIIYSSFFVILPYYIVKRSRNQRFSNYVLIFLLLVMCLEYILILINNNKIDIAIIPKINRFYHSPIFTLFLLASYTVNKRLKND